MSAPEFFELDINDLKQVHELLLSCQLNKNFSYEQWTLYYKWLIQDNPYRKDQAPGYVYKKNDRIIAFVGFSFIPLKIGNTVQIVPNAGDMAIDPEHQGLMGLMFAKDYLTKTPYPTVITTHGSKSGSLIWGRFNANQIPKTDTFYSDCISLKNAFSSYAFAMHPWLGQISRFGLNSLGALLLHLKGVKNIDISSPAYDLNYLYELDHSIVEQLCERFMQRITLGINKDYLYLKWRYFESPDFKSYHCYSISDKKEIKGIGVLKIIKDQSISRICELICDINDENTVREMIQAAVQISKQLGVSKIETRSNFSNCEKTLDEYRFKKYHKTYCQFMMVSKESTPLNDLNLSYFSYGDMKFL